MKTMQSFKSSTNSLTAADLVREKLVLAGITLEDIDLAVEWARENTPVVKKLDNKKLLQTESSFKGET
jgi:hypothetical protein